MRNPDVIEFFAALHAHPEVAHALETALAPLGDLRLVSRDPQFGAVLAATNDVVFCAASGLDHVFFRLAPADLADALAMGADRCGVGQEWARFKAFPTDRPRPDIEFWARRAYDHALAA